MVASAYLWLSPRSSPDSDIELAHGLGFCFEFLLYGVYCVLFIISIFVAHRQGRLLNTSGKVFFICNILLFLIATLFTAINIERFVGAFVKNPNGPTAYFTFPEMTSHWENLATNVLAFLMLHLGDSLVIYRTYIIWFNNLYIILIPCALVLTSIAANVALFTAYEDPTALPRTSISPLLRTVYHIHMIQNIITTGLIITRLWKQHRDSVKAGLHGIGISLLGTIRIIVESASIYTVQLLALIILDSQNSRFTATIQSILVPSTGIVFNLLAVRVYMNQSSRTPGMQLTDLLQRITTESQQGCSTQGAASA